MGRIADLTTRANCGTLATMSAITRFTVLAPNAATTAIAKTSDGTAIKMSMMRMIMFSI